MLQRGNRWLLRSEFGECLDSWSSVIDTQGRGTFAAILCQGALTKLCGRQFTSA